MWWAMDEDEAYIPMQEHFVDFVRAERHSQITGAFFNLFMSMTPIKVPRL